MNFSNTTKVSTLAPYPLKYFLFLKKILELTTSLFSAESLKQILSDKMNKCQLTWTFIQIFLNWWWSFLFMIFFFLKKILGELGADGTRELNLEESSSKSFWFFKYFIITHYFTTCGSVQAFLEDTTVLSINLLPNYLQERQLVIFYLYGIYSRWKWTVTFF